MIIFCFSYDVRGRAFNKALYWSDPAAFGPRAYFVTISKPASLTVESVQLDDEGIYRCRVDFKNSPTRNFQVQLKVIGKSNYLFSIYILTEDFLMRYLNHSRFIIIFIMEYLFTFSEIL